MPFWGTRSCNTRKLWNPPRKRLDFAYGQWDGVVLSAENCRQVFIPRGFAHGFRVLSETADIAYKCDDVCHPEDEGGLLWNDPALGIAWPATEGETAFEERSVVLSEKDRGYPRFDKSLQNN